MMKKNNNEARIEAAEERQRLADLHYQSRVDAEARKKLIAKRQRIEEAIAAKDMQDSTEQAEQRMTMQRPEIGLENYKPFDV